MHEAGGPDDWTIVTVTYNSAAHLRRHWTDAARSDARWIVVDNASGDASVETARALGAEVVRLPQNVGFGAANNVGLDLVTSAWTAFVNPDVTVGQPGDLARLAGTAARTGGLVAPQLLNPDGSEQPNARGLPHPLSKLGNRVRVPGLDPRDYARTGLTEPTFVAWVMGAAVAGSTRTLRDLGGWDPRFFIYYEDHDLGLRAWAAGAPVVLDPSVRWLHAWQRDTTGPKLRPWVHEVRSAARFYRLYPALLTPGRAKRSPLFATISRTLWQPAP